MSRKNRRRLITLFVLVILPASCFFGLSGKGRALAYGWFCAATPAVRNVSVSADGKVDKEAILEIADIQAGSPLLLLPLRSIVARLSENPEYREVAVHRDFSGDVSIEITLRRPAMIIAGGRLRFTDAGGTIFKFVGGDTEADLPVVTGIPNNWNASNPDRRRILSTAVRLHAEVAGLLTEEGQTLSEIHIDAQEGYSLFTDQIGGRVVFGMPPFEPKVERLRTLIKHLKPRLLDIENLDLDYNKRAFIRFKHQGDNVVAWAVTPDVARKETDNSARKGW